jgi:hypothetical protein
MRFRKLRQKNECFEEDLDENELRRVTEFHPHCYLPQLALAEAKLYDETYAFAHRHNPAYGEQEY